MNDVRIDYRTVRTEHFAIHYHEPLGVVARRVAEVCEDAYTRLTPVLEHIPDEITHVALSDGTDSANGSATSLPYNTMNLFISAPEDLTPLGDYDDWLSELIIHEYTHVLHLDTYSGIPAIINTILGKVYAPNLVQPRWFIEGLAVHEESRETTGGRLRSTMFEMYMRMATLSNSLLRIDELSNDIDRWPRGTSWYLYGSRFVEYIAERYGREVLTTISHGYGRQVVPYSINRVARRATGKTFVELYDDWRDHLREKYIAERETVDARGRIEGRRLTSHGETARTPRYLRDGRVAYYASDGRNDSQIRVIDLDGGEPETLTRTSGIGTFAEHPDGRIIHQSVDAVRDIYFYKDLFAVTPATGERVRLTNGLRAREPDISPDGRRVVFTVGSTGTTHLMIADLEDVEESRQMLVRSGRFEQVYTPRFSPDGTKVAYSVWREGGFRDVHVLDLERGTTDEVTRDRAMDTGPTWSRDGETLYFSSDRTGIANIYAFSFETRELKQVTNVIAGAYSPHVSPDGTRIVYVGYTDRGFDLYEIVIRQDQFLEALPSYTRGAARPVTSRVLSSTAYRPRATLVPRSFLLDFRSDHPLGPQLGFTIGGEDIIGFHTYSARLGVSVTSGAVEGQVDWRYNRLAMPLRLRLYRQQRVRDDFFIEGEAREYIEDSVGGELGISYRFPRSFHVETFSLSYGFNYSRTREPFRGLLDPNDPPPTFPSLGLSGVVRGSWSYSDARRHIYDMTPSEGRNFGFGFTITHPLFGSEQRSLSASWAFTRYLEAPWKQHHIFALRYGGGIASGRRGVFLAGGFPNASFVDGLLNGTRLGGVALRGYPVAHRRGNQLHLVQLEYRFPITRLMAGPQTLPVYLKRVYGAVYVDYGNAFDGRLRIEDFLVGFGAELFLDFTLGYFLNFTLRAGVAYGPMEGGGVKPYFSLGVPF